MTDDSIVQRLAADGSRPPAIVVAVQLPGVTDGELASSIAELERLATTLGLEPIARIVQRRGKLASGVVLGDGKLKELAQHTGGTGIVPAYPEPGAEKHDPDDDDDDDADQDDDTVDVEAGAPTRKAKVVLVDHDLTPTQQLNLEKATGVDVLDRTSVILEIFHRHAKTREARLQVEVARLRYLAPRLRVASGGGDRVRGGIGGKGAGEGGARARRRRLR